MEFSLDQTSSQCISGNHIDDAFPNESRYHRDADSPAAIEKTARHGVRQDHPGSGQEEAQEDARRRQLPFPFIRTDRIENSFDHDVLDDQRRDNPKRETADKIRQSRPDRSSQRRLPARTEQD